VSGQAGGHESLAERAGHAFAVYRSGDTRGMDILVDLLTTILWHTARGQGLSSAAAQDVVQTAWLRLVEQADRIEDHRAVLGWLVVTVKRESWRVARASRRDEGVLDPELTDPAAGPEASALLGLRDRNLWAHLGDLDQRCQALLRVIAFADRPDYAAISVALGMPVGSIGPTRGRCLAKLRVALENDPAWEGAR
jgi:RNA polymerase sigma factor (sigma-70 family)